MDYAPYLILCRDQTLAGAYEKFQWQEVVPRQEMIRNRASGRDGNSSNYSRSHRRSHGDTQVPTSSWHHIASVEISSALDSVKSALSWRRNPDKHGAGQSSSTITPQAKRSTKKVSFADEVGLALTTVRVICDSVSSYLSARTSSSYSALPRRQSDVASRFLIKFEQPWKCSDTFRQKVEACNVILSDFVIKNGVINGEIEVKNIAYDKTVFVRYTASDWNCFSDVGASYVSRSEQKVAGYDTFSFQFPVPLDPEKPGRLEFAICYVVSGQSFWDNNCGRNYEIVKVEEPRPPADDAILQEFQSWRLDTHSEKGGNVGRKVVQKGQQQNTTDRIVFSVLQTRPVVWTEFIGWKWGMDYSRPYW